MMAHVALDAQALLDYQSEDRRDVNVHHDLVEFMQKFGILRLRGDDDSIALLEAIAAQSPSVKTLWTKYLGSYRDYRRVQTEELTGTTRDSLLGLTGDLSAQAPLDLALVGEDLADALGIPSSPGRVESANGSPELAFADQVNRTSTKARLDRLRDRNYPKGTSRDKIWNEVYQVPVSISRSAVLLDRYFLTSQGPDWFIGKLAQALAPDSELTLLGEWPKGREESKLKSLVRKRLPPLDNLARIRVVLSPAWDDKNRADGGRRDIGSQKGPHDRHLRLSCGVTIGTEEGHDTLWSPKVQRVDGFTCRCWSSTEMDMDFMKRENLVMNQSTRLDFTVQG